MKVTSNKIFVVIVTYNGMTNFWITKCLQSLMSSSYCVNVIVVDNNSSDNTVSYIKKNHSDVILLTQNENLGFGGANNIGIKFALDNDADYVFLLNQDAYVEKNTIETLVLSHLESSNYGILSPVHLNGDGQKLDRNFSYYVAYDKNEFFYSDLIVSHLNGIYKVPFVNAAAWLIPRNTLINIGGFDNIFYHYGEDDNYCQRLIFHGYDIGICSNAFIKHDRENRRVEERISSSKKLVLLERRYKVQFANVNLSNNQELFRKKISERRKLILLKMLQFNFSEIRLLNQELKLLKSIEKDIYFSVSKNRKLGQHYL